jgi:hypothetical protein
VRRFIAAFCDAKKSGDKSPHSKMPVAMRHLLWKLLTDERGTAGAEWAFVATILVLGAITAAAAWRQAPPLEPDEPAAVGRR